jgi:hypothetical protein
MSVWEIAPDGILDVTIPVDSITNAELQDNSVSSAKLQNASVIAGKLSANSVGGAEIIDYSVERINIRLLTGSGRFSATVPGTYMQIDSAPPGVTIPVVPVPLPGGYPPVSPGLSYVFLPPVGEMNLSNNVILSSYIQKALNSPAPDTVSVQMLLDVDNRLIIFKALKADGTQNDTDTTTVVCFSLLY